MNKKINSTCRVLAKIVASAVLLLSVETMWANDPSMSTIPGKTAQSGPGTHSVSGFVRDASGNPLGGVAVFVAGKNNGVMTNSDGSYKISVSDSDVLTFSCLGYVNVDERVGNRHSINVTLAEEHQAIDEVIVTGYQTISKERATGSYGIVTSDKLEQKVNTNLKSLVEGNVAGLVIDKNGDITIRGISTINAEKKPLIVVDGYPTEISLDELNPNNIENITVLKDGVAASIYGSRSANGVIVVTTKSGREGKTRVGYNGFFKVVPRPDLGALHFSSASDFVDAHLSQYGQDSWYLDSYFAASNPNSIPSVYRLLLERNDGVISDSEFESGIAALRKADGLGQMQKYMFREELTQSHNVTLNGGSGDNTYNLAVNYSNTRGNYINTANNRLNADLKNTWNPWKFLTVSTAVNVRYDNGTSPYTSYTTLLNQNCYYNYWGWMPYDNIVNDDGSLAYYNPTSNRLLSIYSNYPGLKDLSFNPIEDAYENYVNSSTFATRLTGTLLFKIFDGFTAQVGGNWTRSNKEQKTIYTADSYYNRVYFNNSTSKSNPTSHYFPDGDLIKETFTKGEDWTIRTQLNYNKEFGKNRVNALAGNEVRRISSTANAEQTRIGYNAQAGTFESINMKDLKGTAYNTDMVHAPSYFWRSILGYGSYTLADNRFVSWYANGSYEFDNRYLVSGSLRFDQTNLFGTDPKYRYKPMWSVGATWKMSNESWFNVSAIDRLNLRASYGVNGNIALNAGPYLILKPGSYDTITGAVSSSISTYPNNSLRWERTATSNVGLDAEMLRGRLGVTLDYYFKKSTDLLASDALDPTTGASSLMKNVGAINNHGIELSLTGTPVLNRDFRWDVIYNLSVNKSKVIEYNVTRNYASSWAGNTAVHAEGYPMSGMFSYRFAGLDDTGHVLIYGKDDEKKSISEAGVDDVVYSGSLIPTTDMALTNNFRYGNWNLSFMFIAKLGAKLRLDSFTGGNFSNRHFAERWQKPGDESKTVYPVYDINDAGFYYAAFSDIFAASANYLKLRDLTLSYNLPASFAKRIGMDNAKVYLQGRNLFYITAKGVDFDPEAFETDQSASLIEYASYGYTTLPLPAELFVGLTFNF